MPMSTRKTGTKMVFEKKEETKTRVAFSFLARVSIGFTIA